jgi:hypothetical protein
MGSLLFTENLPLVKAYIYYRVSMLATIDIKEIDGSVYNRWSIMFNSIIRDESYQDLIRKVSARVDTDYQETIE